MTLSKQKKRILFLTSSRSEYGIIRNLIINLNQQKIFESGVLVMGDHLLRTKGHTLKEILNDKLKIIGKIKIPKTFYEIKSASIINFQDKIRTKINNYDPNLVIILGDRKEMLVCAQCCFFLDYKIIHISGGEKTIGSKDDIHRHIISKFSDFHFVSDISYKKRLIQLGEAKNKIYVIGSLSTEKIKNINLKNKNEIEKKYKFKFKTHNTLITFHPDTSVFNYKAKDFEELLRALSEFPNLLKIFTFPNSDKGSDLIIKKINEFKKKNENTIIIKSFGQDDYFSTIKNVNFLIGNSSSGITEVPLFKKTTINIGDRQKGRLYSSSIINTKANKNDIIAKIKKVLNKNYIVSLKKIYFHKSNASTNAIKHIKFIINKKKEIKTFVDL